LEIFLHSGEFYFGGAPATISTVLRTRVVLVFWHPRAKIGGMSHFMMAESPAGKGDMRYGDCAIAEISRLAEKYDTKVKDYELHVFKGVDETTDDKQIRQVIDKVKELLQQHKFNVAGVKVDSCFTSRIKIGLSSGNVEKTTKEIKTETESSSAGKSDEGFALEIFLHPGELYFGRAPTIISTLLGSCVAATLWHPEKKIGGMCHIVLPEAINGKCDMKYGDCAIGEFAKQAIKYQTRTKDYKIHLYGGSDMFPDMKKQTGMKIGDRNIEKTEELLKLYKFRVDEVDTGGTTSRKIKLDLSDGSVWTRKTSRLVEE